MRERLLGRLAQFITGRPRTVLVLALALVAVSAPLAIFKVEISTSRNQMIPAGHPEQKKFFAFLTAFGTPNQLALVVEGGDPDTQRAAAEAMAHKLAADTTHVREVFYKIDLSFFRDHALLYLPTADLRRAPAIAASPGLDLDGLVRINGVVPLLDTLEQKVAGAVAGPGRANNPPVPDGDAPMTGAPGAEEGIAVISGFLQTLEQAMKAPPPAGPLKPLEDVFAARIGRETSFIDEQGYLQSKDKAYHFLFVQPASESDDNTFVFPFVDAARAAAADVSRKFPSVKIGVTGLPAMNADENRLLNNDIVLTSAVSFVGVLFLYLFLFKLGRQSLLLTVGLTAGVVWTGGFIALAYGRLNLISSFFIPILLGLGDDFGVHFISRYNEERAHGHNATDAITHTMKEAGPSILTGGLTVAACFYAIGVSKFGAFAEMGIIGGTGLVLEILCALTVLPAMLLVFGGKKLPRAVRAAEAAREKRAAIGLSHDDDGFVAKLIARRPALVLTLAATFTAVMIWQGAGLRMHYDLTELLPRGVESIDAQMKMQRSSAYSAEFGVVTAPSIAEAGRIRAELASRKTIARIESLGDYIPADQEEKLRIFAALRPTVERIRVPQQIAPISQKAVLDSLDRFGDRIDDAYFLAKQGDVKEAPALERLAARIHTAHDAVAKLAQPEADARLAAYQTALFAQLRDGFEFLKKNLAATAVTAETLPTAVRARFVSKDGRAFAVYAYPSRPIWDRSFLQQFVADLNSVSPTATGFPSTFSANIDLVTGGFVRAGLLALAIILLALAADFRSARYALLALGPLLVGGAWMCGLMHTLGIHMNLANLVAFPLVIGLGVDNGVHMLHRFREEGFSDVAHVVKTTGRAILLAGLTTILGFGTMVLATHRGAASFGGIIIIGIGSCMLTATVCLPALLTLLERRRQPVPPESAQVAPPVAKESAAHNR